MARYRIEFWSAFKENEYAYCQAELFNLLPTLKGVSKVIRQYKNGTAKDVTDRYIRFCS